MNKVPLELTSKGLLDAILTSYKSQSFGVGQIYRLAAMVTFPVKVGTKVKT